jgi:heptosyltransferase-2
MKILILRFSSIGDIVLTTPVVRCLKEQLPEVEIHYATKPQYASILEANPHIDKVITLQGSVANLAKTLRTEKYDAVVDLHANLRTRLLRSLLPGISFSVFRKQNMRKWLIVKKLTRKPCEHVVYRYMDTIKKWGVKYDGKGLDYYYNESVVNGLPGKHYIAYAIGGTWATKRMPLNKIEDLIKTSNGHWVLLGDGNDAQVGEMLAAQFPECVTNMCGKLTLDQSAQVLAGAEKVVTHDTGLMHIAAALRKPIVSIWGNTTPDFGMGPFLPGTKNSKPILAEAKGLSCRPCSKIGFNACPKGHFDCMQNQSVEEISRLLNQM